LPELPAALAEYVLGGVVQPAVVPPAPGPRLVPPRDGVDGEPAVPSIPNTKVPAEVVARPRPLAPPAPPPPPHASNCETDEPPAPPPPPATMSLDERVVPPPGQLEAVSEQVRTSVAPPPELAAVNPLL
jgi:hypothetical protein